MLTRRSLLHSSLAVPLVAALGGAARAGRGGLLPVDVSLERVTRRVVGLRPYRPSGFVVKAQRFDDKLVVHNYGHGGGGITLSWGTAMLAAELAWASGQREFGVLGCGAVGLATARVLQRRGARVTIYAKELPPCTTSNVAGGQWMPAKVVDPKRRTASWDAQYERAAEFSYRAFQDLVGERYGVSWMDNYEIARDHAPEAEPFARKDVRDFVPEGSPFPGHYARRWTTMMVQTSHYLQEMMDDVVRFGGRIEVRDLPHLRAVLDLPEEVLLNCTGLGSRVLFGDKELIPIKGQLSVLLPQPEIDYAYLSGGYYMFPRKDGVLLGGTFGWNVDSLEPDLEAEKKVLAFHAAVSAAIAARRG